METPGSHFKSPTTLLSPSRLQELLDILDQTSLTQEQHRGILHELYNALKRESPAFLDLKQQLHNFLQSPNPSGLREFIAVKLIPEPSASSDLLRKKRRQTPRRRYTCKLRRRRNLALSDGSNNLTVAKQ